MSVMNTKGALSGARLLHRVEAMAGGVDKHRGEPGFPNFFARNDIHAEHEELENALLGAKATEAHVRSLADGMKGRARVMRDLYERGVAALESYFGLTSPTLREFGVRPRKGPGSPHSKAARSAKKARERKAAAHPSRHPRRKTKRASRASSG